MNFAKYVIVNNLGTTLAMIFSPDIEHRKMAYGAVGRDVLGAGFVEIFHKKEGLVVKCFGESMSLNAKSRGKVDAEIIQKLLSK